MIGESRPRWPGFDSRSPARHTFRVEKVALFCNPASGGTFSSTAIEIIKWVKKIEVAQAKVLPHLEAWEYCIQRTA
jgi:hypothetical protein